MDIRVLGSAEVWSGDGHRVALPGRLSTKLLVLLALELGHVVPLSTLVAGLWDDAAPSTARRQVQNTVSLLRRKLGGTVVETIGDGYRLRSPGIRVDAHDFTDMTRRARGIQDAGAMRRLLVEALDLWRGKALADLSGRTFEAWAQRLEDARISAVEDLAQVEIDAGDHASAIDLLKPVLVDLPHRQKTAGLLMLTLHRDGRTPEALEVYETLRNRLAEDLGLDPDARLREQHTAILRGTAHTPTRSQPPSVESVAATTPVPAQLPARPGRFVGREEYLSTLDELLTRSRRGRCAVISGAAGAGKTALAVHWAHGVRHHFPDGQLHVNLRGFNPGGPLEVQHALDSLIRSLQPPAAPVPADLEEATRLYRSLLDGKRLLVILDDARDETQVRRLLPWVDTCFTVVTSRHTLAGLTAVDDAGPVHLKPLSHTEATDLLTRLLGTERVDGTPRAFRRLAALCGDLPLALRIASAHLVTHPELPLHDYLASLDGSQRLNALSIEGDPDATISTALDRSFEALNPDTQRLFCRLGLIPGEDFSTALAVEVGGDTEKVARLLLKQLTSAHLLETPGDDRYRFHDLVRLYAAKKAEQLLGETATEDTIDRFIEWHHNRVAESDPMEEANVLAACEELHAHPRLWRLSVSLRRTLHACRSLPRVLAICRTALDNATRCGDLEGRFQSTRLLASSHWAMEESDTAIQLGQDAALIADGLDEYSRGQAKTDLGSYLHAAGRLLEAQTVLQEAVGDVNAGHHRRHHIGGLVNLCGVQVKLGRYDEALAVLSAVERFLAHAEDELIRVYVDDYRARIQLETGQLTEALVAAESVLELAERLHLNRFEYFGHKVRGEARLAQGRYRAAEESLRRALDIARGDKSHSAEIFTHCDLAIAASRRGDHHGAEKALDNALSHPHRGDLGIAQLEAHIDYTSCVVRCGRGDYEAANHSGLAAVERFAAAPRPLLHGRALLWLGNVQAGMGDHDAALGYRRQALDIFDALGVPEAEEVRQVLRSTDG